MIEQTSASSRTRAVGALCLALTLTTACDSSVQGVFSLASPRPVCAVPQDADRAAGEILALVNQERVLRGMNPVTLNNRLSAMAISYACTMIQDEFFGHDHPETGDGFAERHAAGEFRCNPAGENLALGHTAPGIVVEDWMNSPTHREIMLSDDYLEMGIALREDSVDARPYWVQLFVGERVDGCLNELELLEGPPTPSPDTGDLTGGLSNTPTMPSGVGSQGLTDTARVKQESADRTADE